MLPRSSVVDYRALSARAPDAPLDGIVQFFKTELPSLWRDAYVATGKRPAEVFLIQRGEFEFLFDDYLGLEDRGVVPPEPGAESRVVAVHGFSVPARSRRDDHRLRGWVGATEETFGKSWDKGHFIAHSIGGSVVGSELNVFVQRRDLNRGRSEEGKRFRAMERHCWLHPGSYCFARPIYTDGSAQPAYLEFGVLRPDGELWVDCFDNR